MIVTKTPYRFSLFGGGLDFPDWYERHPISVACAALDYHCYISFGNLPPFFPEYNHRIAYSRLEYVKEIDQIAHPSVRNCLKYFSVKFGCDVHHRGDLPAQSGVGTSSAFTVGMVHSISRFLGTTYTRAELAATAIHLERNVIGEPVGVQDQTAAAYGGFIKIDASSTGVLARPLAISDSYIDYLKQNILIGFTGASRNGLNTAQQRIVDLNDNQKESSHRELMDITNSGIASLESEADIQTIGRYLQYSWALKRESLRTESMDLIDSLIRKAMNSGAFGGKLMGAGNHGFFYLLVPPERREEIMAECAKFYDDLRWIPTRFSSSGSTVIYDSTK